MFEHIEEKEAVEKAALIEKNGIRFYTLLLEKIHVPNIREVFKELLKDEKRHLQIVEEEYFPEAGFSDIVTDEELEIENYVKNLGVPDLFMKRINIDKLVAAINDPKKALLIALDTERHSAKFFEHMAGRASTAEGRKMYRELAEEEKAHVKHIEYLLESKA